MKLIKTDVLIIGGGAAGLNAAFHLKEAKNPILVEMPCSNSLLSPWNLMIRPEKELEKEIIEKGCLMNDKRLVRVFTKGIGGVIEDLKEMGVKFRKSNIGIIPAYRLPGRELRKIFLREIKKKITIFEARAENFLVDERKRIRGVGIEFLDGKRADIFFDYMILAAGGISSFFEFTTGDKSINGTILALCFEAGIEMTNLEFFMFHPFLLVDKRFPSLLVSGEILTKMEFEDEKGKPFLSKKIKEALKNDQYHSVFPEMIREFYKQSLKGKIFAKLRCSKEWFKEYKRENEFGFLFKGWNLQGIKKLQFHPAFHSLIGGVRITERAQTSQANIYAAGEITGGLHGANRIGGLAVLEGLVFGKIAAQEINRKLKKKTSSSLNSLKKIKRIGRLKFSPLMRKKVWGVLGPVKTEKKLKEFIDFLSEKKDLSSQEKLVKKIAEISLLRKESVGVFYKEGASQKRIAKNSFLVNQKIIFK